MSPLSRHVGGTLNIAPYFVRFLSVTCVVVSVQVVTIRAANLGPELNPRSNLTTRPRLPLPFAPLSWKMKLLRVSFRRPSLNLLLETKRIMARQLVKQPGTAPTRPLIHVVLVLLLKMMKYLWTRPLSAASLGPLLPSMVCTVSLMG